MDISTVDISVGNTKLQLPMVCNPQADYMQTDFGPARQDTIHDLRAHSVVSHPNSKQDTSKEGEEKADAVHGDWLLGFFGGF